MFDNISYVSVVLQAECDEKPRRIDSCVTKVEKKILLDESPENQTARDALQFRIKRDHLIARGLPQATKVTILAMDAKPEEVKRLLGSEVPQTAFA